MGRSTASCLKIITCGSDSVDNDDLQLQAPENKGSTDKRGWSFRKRSSSRHRVLSNTVISEMPASLNKESSETTTVNLQTQANATFPEKTPAMPWAEERPKLPTSVNLEVSNTRVAAEDDKMQDVYPDESVIVVIQAAVRGVLAQREVMKLKSLVKLQAAVRGHLVRRHAVGTLRCVQAIVKLQTLVRARHARLTFEGSYTEAKPDGNHGKEMKNSLTKPSVVCTSMEKKLLSNKFVHQLLESTPRTKRIHIKCDLSGSDSAWKWLERWMSVSSVGVELSQKPESRIEQQEQDEVECYVSQVECVFPAESLESTNLEGTITETSVPSKSEEKMTSYDADNFVFQACRLSSSSRIDDVELPQPENSGSPTSKEGSLELLHSHTQSDSVSDLLEFKSFQTDSEQTTRCMKRSAPEQGETEGRKYAFGTRKATNPAFIAVQSKFEGLSSTANSARSTSSHKQDDGIELNSDTVSSALDVGIRTTETDLAENSLLHTSTVKVGTSECGTEISVSSTLDSPDRFEIGMIDVDHEIELSEEEISDAANTKKLDIETNNGETCPLGSDLVDSLLVQPEKRDCVNEANGEPVNSVTAEDFLMEKEKSETNASNSVQFELDPQIGQQMYKSSPEASPRSHMTVPELEGTPSSQVSVKAKRTKRDRGSSNQKRKSLSAGKTSPSNPIHDSGVRNSLEQLPKDQKSGKRRNSFGSGKPDYVDQEPRDSNASNSLPSYMQATESARAKALANSSPRSSPDVQDKEIYIKKRHSLPGANGRQGSPRIQRPTSRAQQGTNGNGHPHERKWQR